MDLKRLFGKRGSLKGQAVMEYLITYGLALFVILIVLAILVAVVLPTLKAPETCQFTQPGFTCNQKQHVLVADSGNNVRLQFQLDNNQGKSVKVLGILCTTSPPGNIRKADIASRGLAIPSPGRQMAAGESITAGSSGSTITSNIACVDETGAAVKLSPNSNFKGTLALEYAFTDEVPGAPTRLATATLTGNVLSE
ncbi:MAG: hypothetical protein U0R44_06985 [Candidatus Micrarchaeia archaeon]